MPIILGAACGPGPPNATLVRVPLSSVAATEPVAAALRKSLRVMGCISEAKFIASSKRMAERWEQKNGFLAHLPAASTHRSDKQPFTEQIQFLCEFEYTTHRLVTAITCFPRGCGLGRF